MNRSIFRLFLILSALFAAWTAFFVGSHVGAAESTRTPLRFRRILVLFSVDMAKEDRDAFLSGLEEVRARHQEEYYELVRKWRESAPAESKADSTEPGTVSDGASEFSSASPRDFERAFYHNPYFLDVVDTRMIRTETKNPASNDAPGSIAPNLSDMASVRASDASDGYDALIVAASDAVAADLTRMIRNGRLEASSDKMVVLFAGVSSFDESLRDLQKNGGGRESAKVPYAFAIRHPADPLPNTELALSVFPKTKKVILLTSGRIWNEAKEMAYRAQLGPGKTLKSIPIPEIPKQDVTEADIAEMKNKFAASVRAEIQPDTIIVTMSSVETGQDPASWLPEKFDACPVFSDTIPSGATAVGGFCRSMWNLGVQSADLLEQLSEETLSSNKLPSVIVEDDELLLNESALRRYGLKASSFPGAVALKPTSAGKPPVRRQERTWTRKRIALLLAANAAVLGALFLFALISVRAARRKRLMTEKVYGALPVRVMVMDRDGRIIEHHSQSGEVEQQGEFPWKNIADVPWLEPLNVLALVQSVFDSGKTVVRELEIDGERRVVVLSRTPSDVFGRPAVVVVSSGSPERD